MVDTPAGWYPQEDGRQRYWDGEKWTEHFAPGADHGTPPIAQPVPGSAAADPKPQRPWFKKKRFIIPAGLVAVVILGSALSGGDDPSTSTALETPESTTSTTAPAAPATSAAAPATSAPAAPTSAAAPATSAPAAPKPADNTPKFGSKVRDGKFEFVVTGMKCGIDAVGGAGFDTKAQGEFCRVSMKITNIGDEAQSMFADNQLALDGKNRKFSADTEASIYDEKSQILFEEINPGNTVEGRVYFDVPKGTKLVRMELHDSLFSGGVEVALRK